MSVISSDELYDFYAHLGQALHAIQRVESAVHAVLCIKLHFANQRPSASEAEQIREKYRSQTLGALIKIVKNNAALESEIVDKLEKLNQQRRMVVHRLEERTDLQLRAISGFREDIIVELDEIADSAFSLNGCIIAAAVESAPASVLTSATFQTLYADELERRGFATK